MCWPVRSQLRAPWRSTQTGSFPLKLDAQGNQPCFAWGNQRLFDRRGRLMADCIRLKCSPTKAAAKVNRSRALSQPPSNTSLFNSCYHLAEKNHQHSSSQNVCGTCEMAISAHILWLRPLSQFFPPPSVNSMNEVAVTTSEYCFVALNICTLWLCCLVCLVFDQESETLRMAACTFSSDIMIAYRYLQNSQCCRKHDTVR